MRRRVAITGLGVVTPLGTSVQSTWEGLVAGRSGAGPITRFDPAQSPVKFACEVKGFEPAKFLDKKEVRRYDLFAQFAIGAAEQAVADACLVNNWDKLDLRRAGVLIGTGTGGLQTFEENCRALFEKGPSRVSPFFVPMYMPNVAAALISMRYGAKGPNYCTVSACASSAHSVGDALDLIRNDKADLMIAGGAEAAITPLAVASFANMKALSERNDDPQTASRPFDKDRDGFVMGDGAAVLILEEWEHAQHQPVHPRPGLRPRLGAEPGRETARRRRALELLRVRGTQRDARDQAGRVKGDPALQPIAEKVERGERLDRDDALDLFNSADLLTVGRLADLANCRLNGDRVYFAANQHLNPTNVCVLRNTCVFCSFARMPQESGAYTRSLDEVFAEADAARDNPTREFHIVGGLHPKLRRAYYLEMFRGLRERHPGVHIKALTAVEIAHLARIEKLSVRDVLAAMQAAGVTSLPGGGAEVCR